MCVSMCLRVCRYVCEHVYVSMYVCRYVCACVCVCVCVCVLSGTACGSFLKSVLNIWCFVPFVCVLALFVSLCCVTSSYLSSASGARKRAKRATRAKRSRRMHILRGSGHAWGLVSVCVLPFFYMLFVCA